MDERDKQREVGKMWVGVFAALVVIVLICYALYEIGPENEPPPVNDTREIDAGLAPGCTLRATQPGSAVPVHRRPGPGEMIVGEVPHDAELDVISVRRSWVEVRGPLAGWIDRRFVVTVCP